jgi:hypothetical protein
VLNSRSNLSGKKTRLRTRLFVAAIPKCYGKNLQYICVLNKNGKEKTAE